MQYVSPLMSAQTSIQISLFQYQKNIILTCNLRYVGSKSFLPFPLFQLSNLEFLNMALMYNLVLCLLTLAHYGNNFFVCNKLRNLNNYKNNTSLFRNRSFLAFPVAKIIHRNIIGNRRFNPKFKNGEDALFITSISDRIERIEFTSPNAIYYVRERIGSASRKKIPLKLLLKDSILLIITYIYVYIQHPFSYNVLLF